MQTKTRVLPLHTLHAPKGASDAPVVRIGVLVVLTLLFVVILLTAPYHPRYADNQREDDKGNRFHVLVAHL